MSSEQPDLIPPQPLPDWMRPKPPTDGPPSAASSTPNPFGTSTGGPPKEFLPPKPPVFHPDIQSLMKNKLHDASGGGSSSSKTENPIAPKAKSMSPTPAAHGIHKPPPVPPNTAVPSPQPEPEEPITPKPGELEIKPNFPTITSPCTEIPLSPPSAPAAEMSTSEHNKNTGPIQAKDEKSPEPSSSQGERVDMTGGFVSWFTKAVTESKLLSDVAEKAKIGMEQVLTTLDPGMKGFLSEDGVDMYMVNTNINAVKSVREGFERVFANVLIRTVPAAKVDPPVLVRGSAAALKACHERIIRLRNSKLVPQSAPIIVIQPFIMDIDGVIYSSTRLLFNWKEHEFDAIAQLLKVDEKIVNYLEKRAVMDGKPENEYSITLTQAAKEVYNWSSSESESWGGPSPPFSFCEHLTTAASSLALDFMNLNLQITSEAEEVKESDK